MQRCKTCESVLPDDARLCGHCGRTIAPGPSLLGTLVGQGRAFMANMPIEQGIPQVGRVLMVDGTPSTSSGPGAMRSTVPAQDLVSSPDKQVRRSTPQLSYPPTPYYYWHRYQRPKVPATRWLIITISSLLIIAGIIGGLALLLPPTISLSNSVIRQGDTLHLHGSGFIPDGSVTLTLDGHRPLVLFVHNVPGESFYSLGDPSVLQKFAGRQATLPVRSIHVSLRGTFEVAIAVSQNWPLGMHTIRAMEGVSERSAEVRFTIVALPGKLVVTPSSLDFGVLQKGSTTTQILTISNMGQLPLNWTAKEYPSMNRAPTINRGATTTWFTLDTNAGTLQPGTFQTIHVTADATMLAVRTYSGTLAISMGSESMQVGVSLVVTAAPVPSPTPTPTQNKMQMQPPQPHKLPPARPPKPHPGQRRRQRGR
jgi:hypothetical protein